MPAELTEFDLHRIRELGADPAARLALQRLERADLDGYFVHLDADVLNDVIMPALDFRIPFGLSRDELAKVLV